MNKAALQKPRSARLVLDAGVGTVYPLILKETLVGRIDSAHLVLDDNTVSRLHARLVVGPAGVTVQDLDSRDGTWVNGVAVKLPHLLADGDLLAFGDVVVTFSWQEQS